MHENKKTSLGRVLATTLYQYHVASYPRVRCISVIEPHKYIALLLYQAQPKEEICNSSQENIRKMPIIDTHQ
ncbi:TPA: hypothetical protein I7745_03165 [Vibrio vulnificus]|nr:hypothetical protein [Vibrio vulnificus]